MRVKMPAAMSVQLLDTIALVHDLPELGLAAGELGAVIEVLDDNALEVEFVDAAGHTCGLHTIRADQLVVLHTKGRPLKAPLQAA